MEMITLRRGDKDFQSYLMGTFARDRRALPIRSFDVSSPRESVTFQILPIEQCRPPQVWQIVLQALRPGTYVLSLGTLVATFFMSVQAHPKINWFLLILSAMSVFCLHASANLFNDFYDHYRGVDRLNVKSGSRVIQRGWLSARDVWRWAILFFVVAVGLALPIFALRWSLIPIVATIGGLGVLEYSSNRIGFKYHALGEVILFLLFGPALTLGFGMAISGQWLMAALWPGIFLGFSAAQFYFFRNVQNIMSDSQLGSFTLATRAGFDGAQKLALWFAGVQIVTVLAFGYLTHRWLASSFILLTLLTAQAVLLPQLLRARSSLASEIQNLQHRAWLSHLALIMALIVVSL